MRQKLTGLEEEEESLLLELESPTPLCQERADPAAGQEGHRWTRQHRQVTCTWRTSISLLHPAAAECAHSQARLARSPRRSTLTHPKEQKSHNVCSQTRVELQEKSVTKRQLRNPQIFANKIPCHTVLIFV